MTAIRIWYATEGGRKKRMLYVEDESSAVYIKTLSNHCLDIMKSTGCRDVNHREIYEKDILEKDGRRGTVFYSRIDECMQVLFNDGVVERLGFKTSKRFKIIGNIYNTPMAIAV